VSCPSEPYNVMFESLVCIVIQSYMFDVIISDDSVYFCDTILYVNCDTILYVNCDTILYVCFLCLFEHVSDDSDEENQVVQYLEKRSQKRRQIALIDTIFNMYHYETHMNKSEYRVPTESGYNWVMKNLGHSTSCYNIFRMNKHVFDRIHNVLVESWIEGNKEDATIVFLIC
jgi:hypothetical protein